MGHQQSWSKEGTIKDCQRKEASIQWSHHENKQVSCMEKEIMQGAMPGARMRGRRCAHSLDGQHQDVDRTHHERVNQNGRGQR